MLFVGYVSPKILKNSEKLRGGIRELKNPVPEKIGHSISLLMDSEKGFLGRLHLVQNDSDPVSRCDLLRGNPTPIKSTAQPLEGVN